VRVIRAKALGQDVLNPGGLNHGANSTTCNDASAVGSWLQNHVPCAESSGHFEGDGSVHDRNPNEIFFGLFQTLANSFRHFVGFAHSAANHGVVVADHDQGAEAEPTATLDHFSHPANVNDFFLEF
jgi:hypothetical protein